MSCAVVVGGDANNGRNLAAGAAGQGLLNMNFTAVNTNILLMINDFVRRIHHLQWTAVMSFFAPYGTAFSPWKGPAPSARNQSKGGGWNGDCFDATGTLILLPELLNA